MPEPNDNSWKDASVVVVAPASEEKAAAAYTLANALDAVVGHVVLIRLTTATTTSIQRAGNLPIIFLDNVPDVVDWPVDLVINVAADDEHAQRFCRQLQQQQQCLWVERHDSVAAAQADQHWRLTAADSEQPVIAQPRWQRWQEQGLLNQYFIDNLRSALVELGDPSQGGVVASTESTATAASEQRDVVLFWKQNDSGLYGRRSDQVAKYLASRADVRQVLLIDAPIELVNLKKRRATDNFDQNAYIYQGTLLKAFRQSDDAGIKRRVFCFDKGRAGASEYFDYLQRLFDEAGIDVAEAIFWLYPKLQWGESLLEHFQPYRRVVDVVDDHRAWPGISQQKREQLTAHYQALLNGADKVITNCLPVKLSMYEFNRDIALVANGCETAPSVDAPTNNEDYRRIVEHAGPVLGFVGNLEAKIDEQLLRQLAAECPDALIVLVGSTHANPDIRGLAELPNVLMTGVVPYPYIGGLIQQFTLGLVPHKQMALTDNMNPLKVYVYLAHQVPVVATNVPNIARGDYVWQSSDHAEFIANVRHVIDQRESLKSEVFQDFIDRNSWQMRLAVIVDGILA